MRKERPYSWSKVYLLHKGSQSAWLQFSGYLSWKMLAHLEDSHLFHHLSVILSLTVFQNTGWSRHAEVQILTSCITKANYLTYQWISSLWNRATVKPKWCNMCTSEGYSLECVVFRGIAVITTSVFIWFQEGWEHKTLGFGISKFCSDSAMSFNDCDICNFCISNAQFHEFKLRVTLAFAVPFSLRSFLSDPDKTWSSLQSVNVSASTLKKSL